MPYANPDAQRKFQREWQAERRRAAIEERGGACEWCGSDEDLHFHHRDPSTKLSHNVWSWRADRREAELAKCDLICRTCHEEHHRLDRRIAKYERLIADPHDGSSLIHYNHGCRCPVCKATKSRANASYRAKQTAAAKERTTP